MGTSEGRGALSSVHGFTVENDEVLHRWYTFTLVRRIIRSPHGVSHERSFVSSPGAVGVVALTPENDVVLVEQYRPSLDTSLLEIPAGMRDVPGEDPGVTARRELLEETGLMADDWVHLGATIGSAAVTNSRVEIFLATGLRSGSRDPHGPEEEEMVIHHIPLSVALSMVESGEIVDSKTSVGLLLVARARGL